MQTMKPQQLSSETDGAIAVRALYRQLMAAWARGDGAAYGQLFTADADYIAFDGSHTRGSAEIGSSHQALFDTWLKGTRLIGDITAVRELDLNVVLAHAIGGTIMPGRVRASSSRDSIQTLVAVRREDGWRFTAFHNNRIQRRSRFSLFLFGIATKVFHR